MSNRSDRTCTPLAACLGRFHVPCSGAASAKAGICQNLAVAMEQVPGWCSRRILPAPSLCLPANSRQTPPRRSPPDWSGPGYCCGMRDIKNVRIMASSCSLDLPTPLPDSDPAATLLCLGCCCWAPSCSSAVRALEENNAPHTALRSDFKSTRKPPLRLAS
jgi:hypothetical protein